MFVTVGNFHASLCLQGRLEPFQVDPLSVLPENISLGVDVTDIDIHSRLLFDCK